MRVTPAIGCTSSARAQQGRITAAQLDELCADWRERETFLCGPAGLLETIGERFERDGDRARLHMEHFQPDARVGDGERGSGGTIHFHQEPDRGAQRRRAADSR